MKKLALLLALVASFVAPVALSNQQAPEQRSLDFDVFLDGSKIGWHRFEIGSGDDGAREVISRANFDVKFLFITAFRYRHANEERWVDGCLADIDAETDSNGKRTAISGSRSGDAFVLDTGDRKAELPSCVMTFAYWNPDFLEQPRLLNPQTGEYLEVDVDELGTENLVIDGREVAARGYRIRARGVEVTVWYSADDQWVALESLVKGGRTIRYELS